jgi:hypothetical protein
MTRLSWLMAGGTNCPYAAVLCAGNVMPYTPVKNLYENGIDFNYLDIDSNVCSVSDGVMTVGEYKYDLLLLDESVSVSPAAQRVLDGYVSSGGKLYRGADFYGSVGENAALNESFAPHSPFLRITRIKKGGIDFYLLTNENDSKETPIKGKFTTNVIGRACVMDLYTGEQEPAACRFENDKLVFDVEIEPYHCLLLAIDTSLPPEDYAPPAYETIETICLAGLDITVHGNKEPLVTETTFKISAGHDRYTLVLDIMRAMCGVEIDGKTGTDIMLKPYRQDITSLLDKNRGEHTIKLTLTPSPANKFGAPVASVISGARMIAENRL